jgi:SAM-dependent methyltransferase
MAPSDRVDGALDVEELRQAIRDEYATVARNPEQGFHFHTGRHLAQLLGYDDAWLDGIPEGTLASFAGTGNPFPQGALLPGERVVDVGCGAGFDSLIAARMVGAEGRVVGVDMTPAMLAKARESWQSAAEAGSASLTFREGYAEAPLSPTAGRMSSSPMGSSIWSLIRRLPSPRWRACSSPADARRSPIFWCKDRCRRARNVR